MRSRRWSFILSCVCASLVMGFPRRLQPSMRPGHLDAQSIGDFLKSNSIYSQNLGTPLCNFKSDTFQKIGTEFTKWTSCDSVDRTATLWKKARRAFVAIALIPAVLAANAVNSYADDELAKFAAAGHSVGVDGKCFLTKCPLETAECANDRTCLKGLSCLARCKGGSMCSTGCFAKFGSSHLDGLLQCSVESNDCVHVPGKENVGWNVDTISDLPSKPLVQFNPASMKGVWYKTMGLDSRYDCFDCQKNSFSLTDKDTLSMEAVFRIPRPNFPGYLQSKIEEELHITDPGGANSIANMQSQGKMFGLTFWENWYVLGDTKYYRSTPQTGLISSAYASDNYKSKPDLKLVFYTGHTLQGSYKGAFLYSRTHTLSASDMEAAKKLISDSGLDPTKFCVIRNQCFLNENDAKSSKGRKAAQQELEAAKGQATPFWYIGQNFFRATEVIAGELADWFDDPAILSEWLVSQQVKMMQEQPMAVSPFAGLDDWMSDYKENQ